MGAIIRAQCSCGYDSGALPEGVGFARRGNLIARCIQCRDIIAVRADTSPMRCHQCQGPVVILDRVPIGEGAVPIECPRCSEMTLTCAAEGMWD